MNFKVWTPVLYLILFAFYLILFYATILCRFNLGLFTTFCIIIIILILTAAAGKLS